MAVLRTLLPAFIALLLSTPPAAGQAWTPPRGHFYTKVSHGRTTARQQFTFDGRETAYFEGIDGGRYLDRSLYYYLELGLTDALALVLNLPYKRTFVEDAAFRYRTFAFGSASLGLRLSLMPWVAPGPSPHALAVAATAYVPLGYTRNYTPSVGAGQVDAQVSLHYGLSLYPFPAYAQAGGGYRYRSSVYGLSRAADCRAGRGLDCFADTRPAYGDEWVYWAEVGLTPFGGMLLVQGLVQGVHAVDAPAVGFSGLNPIPTRQRYLKAGGGLTVYPFARRGPAALRTVGLGLVYFTTPTGRNTIKSEDVFVGIEYRGSVF